MLKQIVGFTVSESLIFIECIPTATGYLTNLFKLWIWQVEPWSHM